MSSGRKILGEERRTLILQYLKQSHEPITGSKLARKANVSRQVIVNDITILKARNEPIIATSQGYMYLPRSGSDGIFERTIACHHSPDEVEAELNLFVDHGLTVKDVKIEHPVYGDLTASIMVSNRKEVEQFMAKIRETNASYLSELTDGVHLHTVSAKDSHAIDAAEKALKKAGFLLNE